MLCCAALFLVSMAVHARGQTTWQPHISSTKRHGPPSRPLTDVPNAADSRPERPLPPPPLLAFADSDNTDTLGAARPSANIAHPATSRPVNAIPIERIHQAELKRQDSGVAIELEDDFSSFVASSPSIFKASVLGGIKSGRGSDSSGEGMSASPPSVAQQQGRRSRSVNRLSVGPRLPVRVVSADNHPGGLLGEPSLKVVGVERPLTPTSTPGDSAVRLPRRSTRGIPSCETRQARQLC